MNVASKLKQANLRAAEIQMRNSQMRLKNEMRQELKRQQDEQKTLKNIFYDKN